MALDSRSPPVEVWTDLGISRLAPGIRIIRIAAWVSLAVGALASTEDSAGSLVVAATLLGGTFVVAATVVKVETLAPARPPLEIFSLAGAILTVMAASLTGGLDSPFVLLALMPGLLAAMVGGFRIGLTTSMLSGGLIAAVSASQLGIQALVASAGVIALFPLMALLVGQIRSLLIEAEKRATSLELATAEAEGEVLRLGQANELLHRLTDLYGEGNTNPVDVGRAAIQAIIEAHPRSFATATLFDAEGPVVVARVGTDSSELVRAQIPLGDGDTTLGVVSIGSPEPLTTQERHDIDRLLRPVAVSFANALLLQEIAGTAVKEERLRLARELHDEVGPALAALALSLDGTVLQVKDRQVTEEIEDIRGRLGTVVEDLRGIISDLRAEDAPSITNALTAALANLESPPDIKVEVHERRPPRAAASRHILPIVTEAVRNAHHHADATQVTISGMVDRSYVDVRVTDNGAGFDPLQLPDGHYGIMGMRERADRIGASVSIHSDARGTELHLLWKEGQ